MYSASLHAINSVVTQFNFYPPERQLFQTKMSQYNILKKYAYRRSGGKKFQFDLQLWPNRRPRWLLRKIGNAIIAMDFNIFSAN